MTIQKTDLEIYLENNGVYTVHNIFRKLRENPINDVALVNIYQYGVNKKGNIYHASINYNGEHDSFSGSMETLNKQIKKHLLGKASVTNYEGKALKASYSAVEPVESHIKSLIGNIEHIIGSHELLNILVSKL